MNVITSGVRLTRILVLHMTKREMREQQQHSFNAKLELPGKTMTFWQN